MLFGDDEAEIIFLVARISDDSDLDSSIDAMHKLSYDHAFLFEMFNCLGMFPNDEGHSALGQAPEKKAVRNDQYEHQEACDVIAVVHQNDRDEDEQER